MDRPTTRAKSTAPLYGVTIIPAQALVARATTSPMSTPPALVFDKPYLLTVEMPERIPKVHSSLKPLRNFMPTFFGEVADQPSRDVIDAIDAVETGAQDRPTVNVVTSSITRNRTNGPAPWGNSSSKSGTLNASVNPSLPPPAAPATHVPLPYATA